MASIKPHKNKWRASIFKKIDGVVYRPTRIFPSKTAAQAWAIKTEAAILTGEYKNQHVLNADNRTVQDMFELYIERVSTRKRSFRWEKNKLRFIGKMIGSVMLTQLSPGVMSKWRDDRLKTVSNAAVNRDWNLLNNVFNVAVKEWEWLDKNPLENVKRPAGTKSRDRLISDSEIEMILLTTGYDQCPKTISSRVGAAFLFAIETAMRAGEIAGLRKEYIDLDKRTAFLPMTKNGTERYVPLSTKAVEILKSVDCDFKLSSSQIDSLFRKSRNKTPITDLHFHDSRHQGITNLAKKFHVLALARAVGIKDLKILMVYYNETAEEMAKLLD